MWTTTATPHASWLPRSLGSHFDPLLDHCDQDDGLGDHDDGVGHDVGGLGQDDAATIRAWLHCQECSGDSQPGRDSFSKRFNSNGDAGFKSVVSQVFRRITVSVTINFQDLLRIATITSKNHVFNCYREP